MSVRQILAGLLFMAVVVTRDRARLVKLWTTPADRKQLLLFTAFGLLFNQFCYLSAVRLTNAGTATVLQCLQLVIIMGYACVTDRRMPRTREVIGIGLALGILLEGTRMIESPEGDVADSAPPPEVGYFKKTETQRLQDLLRAAILKLNASERRVIRYHYQQDVSFEEISHILGVTRGRVSQIHRQALLNLRKALAQGPPCDVFL